MKKIHLRFIQICATLVILSMDIAAGIAIISQPEKFDGVVFFLAVATMCMSIMGFWWIWCCAPDVE